MINATMHTDNNGSRLSRPARYNLPVVNRCKCVPARVPAVYICRIDALADLQHNGATESDQTSQQSSRKVLKMSWTRMAAYDVG